MKWSSASNFQQTKLHILVFYRSPKIRIMSKMYGNDYPIFTINQIFRLLETSDMNKSSYKKMWRLNLEATVFENVSNFRYLMCFNKNVMNTLHISLKRDPVTS